MSMQYTACYICSIDCHLRSKWMRLVCLSRCRKHSIQSIILYRSHSEFTANSLEIDVMIVNIKLLIAWLKFCSQKSHENTKRALNWRHHNYVCFVGTKRSTAQTPSHSQTSTATTTTTKIIECFCDRFWIRFYLI